MLPLRTLWPKAGLVGLWLDQGVLLAFVVVFAAGIVLFIGLARMQVWLSGDCLIRQGPFWRSKLLLREARFSMKVIKWRYTTQLDSGAVRTVEMQSPALVIRTSWWRRAKVPLVQQAGHRIVGERVVVAWLPLDIREALAAAIEQHATDPKKDRVARFLRHVDRSPVRPEGSADLPGLP